MMYNVREKTSTELSRQQKIDEFRRLNVRLLVVEENEEKNFYFFK